MNGSFYTSLVLAGAVCTAAIAAEPDWRPVATELLKTEKTGFGGLCGVVVDHASGELWVNLSDHGMFLSSDQGRSWQRCGDQQPKGRTETPGCWLLDPTGKTKTMVTALVYGSPIAVSNDRAATWKHLDDKASHVDWCAVDWSSVDGSNTEAGRESVSTFVLALKHEAGGLLLKSTDGGKAFTEVGKGFGTGWVFDRQTAVVARVKDNETAKPTLVRTTDGGQTFQPCGDYSPVGNQSAQALPKWHEGTLYWLTDQGLIATTDRAQTWKKIGEIKDAQYGPIFGKDARHLFVLTKAGVVESTDGGASWNPPLPPPKEISGIGGLSWLEYDPTSDAVYLMKMGSDLYRLGRRE